VRYIVAAVSLVVALAVFWFNVDADDAVKEKKKVRALSLLLGSLALNLAGGLCSYGSWIFSPGGRSFIPIEAVNARAHARARRADICWTSGGRRAATRLPSALPPPCTRSGAPISFNFFLHKHRFNTISQQAR